MHLTILHIPSKRCEQFEPFMIDFDPSFTIIQVKDKIAQYINVLPCDQFLSFEGRTLEDKHTLTSYENIKNGSNLWMVTCPEVIREKYHVFVSIHTTNNERNVIDLNIFYYDTVAQVKHAIYERTSIPMDQQRIVFAGKQIEDNRIFSNYGIQKDSTVHLIIRS
ncbi:unnamed protein product [Adineta steineri]|uniref:Ubiquitin-like domain-containing protein n=1 Tax=Adineta steineri TaxID=433720 RepID=A0A814LHC8_9BILA|nr:unnamed protein product [Adineta steineri]